MVRKGRCKQGFTLVELLVVIGIIALLAAILLPVLAAATAQARATRCRGKLQQTYQGIRMYLNYSEEYFPPAWHKDAAINAELSNLAFHRFLIHESCENNFSRVYKAPDPETADLKFKRDRTFWEDPAAGWTKDYFAPTLVFRGPMTGDTIDFDATAVYDKHAQYSELIKDVGPTERPLFSEVNASYANPDAKDPKDLAHEAEMKSGFCLTTGPASVGQVYVGVAKSLRTLTDETTYRFDFRHNRRINVIWLDGHTEGIAETDKDRQHRVHQRWNNLVPGV